MVPIPTEITNHGQPGYRRGCRCETCRRGHREHNAEWRAGKRRRDAEAAAAGSEPLVAVEAPLREPLAAGAGSLDLTAEPGAIESALLRDMAEPDEKVAWRRTLTGMGRLNARMLDQVATLDRLDLVSPVQLRLLEILNRLAIIGFAGMSDDGDGERAGVGGGVPDDARSLLDEMDG